MTAAVCWVSGIVFALFVISQLRFVLLMMLARRVRPVYVNHSSTPLVAIQVATYRETETIASLLDAICRLDWPHDKLMVQILDDSPPTDATRIDAVITEYANRGLPVSCHRRGSREGFKAGALNHGLEVANPAEYIAFFDADCRPDPQFLRKTIPYLADPQVAAVQARWRFPNALVSPLTAIQAAAFEYLFVYDLPVRASLNLPSYYFGSAAVWRRSVPLALGGWHFKPFTAEDVDMGLRAGNAGWKLLYVDDDLAEDDAIEDILAFRTQQRRWAQAVLQAGVSALGSLPRSRRQLLATMIDWSSFAPHALIPLSVLVTLCMALWILLQVPPAPALFWCLSALMIASPATLAIILAQSRLHRCDWSTRVLLLLQSGPYLAATMTSFLLGLIDFLHPDKLEFVATPKSGRAGVIDGRTAKWIRAHIAPVILDAGFALLFGTAAAVAWQNAMHSALLPLSLMSVQFFASSILTGGALLKRVRIKDSEKPASC